jgi:outer membrane protein OmpA-like peptidoglycan-associated protein
MRGFAIARSAVFVFWGSWLTAQAPPDVLIRSTQAIGYQPGGATSIGFKGTELMPHAAGAATIKVKRGYTEINASFKQLLAAKKFGAEFLTYVLWAVSPEGRAANLGEILISGFGEGRLKVSSQMQTFSLIVTAEPYFGVRLPSELVVIENEARRETRGKRFPVREYSLMKTARYHKLANPLALAPDLRSQPLDIYEARNALAIAQSNAADQYAADIYSKAAASLKVAENHLRAKAERKQVISMARQAVQFSEDALTLALERQEQERLNNERAAREAGERRAQEQAHQEALRRAEAEAARARAEAEQAKALAAQEAASYRAEREAEQRAQAENDRERARTAHRQAEQRWRQAEAEKGEIRARLLKQFSLVLETRDTERGLIVNMPDILFESSKHILRPEAREKLARIGGIVINYPKLRIEAEGHTDNVGSAAYNQKLSEQRAYEVRCYLISQGVPLASMQWTGRGFDAPVASNDTAAGRRQNRRVELIVSGEVIGTAVGRADR